MSTELESKIRYWSQWINHIASDWSGEVPMRIHGRDTDDGGNPDFHPEFVNYIGYLECSQPGCAECAKERSKLHNRANRDGRSRATKALRKVRRVAPKEFDTVYSICVLGMSPSATAERFNANAIAKGYPERYRTSDVIVLLYSGIDKVIHFWRSS